MLTHFQTLTIWGRRRPFDFVAGDCSRSDISYWGVGRYEGPLRVMGQIYSVPDRSYPWGRLGPPDLCTSPRSTRQQWRVAESLAQWSSYGTLKSGRPVKSRAFRIDVVSQRAIRRYQAIWRGQQEKGVENRGVGTPEVALLDGTAVSHAMSTQWSWEKTAPEDSGGATKRRPIFQTLRTTTKFTVKWVCISMLYLGPTRRDGVDKCSVGDIRLLKSRDRTTVGTLGREARIDAI